MILEVDPSAGQSGDLAPWIAVASKIRGIGPQGPHGHGMWDGVASVNDTQVGGTERAFDVQRAFDTAYSAEVPDRHERRNAGKQRGVGQNIGDRSCTEDLDKVIAIEVGFQGYALGTSILVKDGSGRDAGDFTPGQIRARLIIGVC